MGRCRGGLTTKIHALVDAEGRPIHLALTAGQAGDAPTGRERLAHLAPGGILLADKAYDTDAIRAETAERDAFAKAPPRTIRKRTFAFTSCLYRQRNQIERFFNRIKQRRGLAARYDRHPEDFLAALKLAATRIWSKTP
ncbi:transposase [Angulomicrobium tetraedrale]|uniref:Transposase n=1 Tax=Ancylobacter tetraedralis TaxID=217068 RepID=A0A839Z7S1_9HYPH|nr:transposase [Ancylobacter tetraedralis]